MCHTITVSLVIMVISFCHPFVGGFFMALKKSSEGLESWILKKMSKNSGIINLREWDNNSKYECLYETFLSIYNFANTLYKINSKIESRTVLINPTANVTINLKAKSFIFIN